MNNKTNTVLLAVLVTLVGLMALGGLTGGPSSMVPTARADALGGIVGSNLYAPVLDGRHGYTTSVTYSSAVGMAGFGSVQIMLNSVVTGSQTITVTPQFSMQDLPCASVTQWFSSTTYLPYQPYAIVSSATTVTESVGAWMTTPVIDQFSVTQSGVAQREVSAQGQCLRVRLEFSNAGQVYTPTVAVRALNRN